MIQGLFVRSHLKYKCIVNASVFFKFGYGGGFVSFSSVEKKKKKTIKRELH